MRSNHIHHHPLFIQSLLDSSRYPHPVTRVEIEETHISWVLLTGSYAYKIKKPVNLGFVDFTTLEKRHFYCMEELRLNRRLAPHLYLEVIPLSGTPKNPNFEGSGPVIEYAVKMRQFPQANLIDCVLEREELPDALIDHLAQDIATFHAGIAVAKAETSFGTQELVRRPVQECFEQIPPSLGTNKHLAQIERLCTWVEQEYMARSESFARRKHGGFIRECHGDLHLGNMTLEPGRITVFDCIEFNESLRWIDVMSEVAFLTMDLQSRHRQDLSARFFNRYLECTGDYTGVEVFRFYEVYRALVRAKVAGIRLSQEGLNREEQSAITTDFERYLVLAEHLTQPRGSGIMIMHGLSGVGKTTVSQSLLQQTGAIRIRSDVERKRLFGLTPEAKSRSDIGRGLYREEATHATYKRLQELVPIILSSGFPVIVDATFLHRRHRDSFARLAERLHVPFVILHARASAEDMQRRIVAREEAGGEASEANLAVLESQQQTLEPLSPEEQTSTLSLDSSNPEDIQRVAEDLLTRL